MISNVVLGRPRDGVGPAEVEPALAAIVALDPPGLIDCRVGWDLRLRDESWGFAITSDPTSVREADAARRRLLGEEEAVDADAYRAYDREAEHNRVRRAMFAPLCAEIARVQFEA